MVKSRQKLTVVSLSHDFMMIPNLCAILLSCSLTSITFFCTKLELCKYYEEYIGNMCVSDHKSPALSLSSGG